MTLHKLFKILAPTMLWLLLAASAFAAPPAVNAGPDQIIHTLSTRLDGSATNLTALRFWTADGNHATENMLIKYDSTAGITYLGPMHDAAGAIYGWPSDFERIQGNVYGIDTY